MVERMKRVDLFVADIDSDALLDDLRTLGVLHIVENTVDDDKGLSEIEGCINTLKRTMADLKNLPDNTSSVQDHTEFASAYALSDEVKSILAEHTKTEIQNEALVRDMAIIKPWGDFNPDIIRHLNDADVHISYHILSRKSFAQIDWDNRHIEVIHASSEVLFVDIRYADDAPLQIPEIQLPSSTYSELKTQLTQSKKTAASLQSRLHSISQHKALVDAEITALEAKYQRRMAELSLSSHGNGKIVLLSGYIPLSLLSLLKEFLEKRSILPVFSDPKNLMDTPIRLKNNRFIALFEPITRIFNLPKYIEIDTTPFVAPFFTFFFGICLADAGYGALLTLSALAGMLFLRAKPARSLAALGFILGLATILGGLLFNTLFGIEISTLPKIPKGLHSALLFQDINDAMAFSISLGVVQILFGFVLQIVNKVRMEGPIAGMQPVGTFFFLAGVILAGVSALLGDTFSIGPMSVGRWMNLGGNGTIIGLVVSSIGVAVILLFNNYRKAFWMRPILGIWELYGIVSGLLGDVLSYIRLFALALAGSLLGGAVNLIALMIKGEDPGILSLVFMLLVLIGGHGINFALAALGAFVHPLRLTFVEFYKSVGFIGGGKPYKPYGGKSL